MTNKICIEIPNELYKEVKHKCIDLGVTQKEFYHQAIAEKVAKGDN